MNKQTEINRLKSLGLKEKAIARTLKMSRKTVRKYLTEQTPVMAVESEQRFSWEEIIIDHQVNDVPIQVLWEELKE